MSKQVPRSFSVPPANTTTFMVNNSDSDINGKLAHGGTAQSLNATHNENEYTTNNIDPNKHVKQSFMDAARSKALRPFVIISSSYLLFTITDGALRMIVLLHAYNERFSALEVAIMFTLYELAGVFTNLAAGIMGARWGIKYTLIGGLCLQLFSYGLLFGWQPGWTKTQAIIYVTIAQMFAGISKDLTKLGGKTVTKLVTPEEKETQLFKLVSLLTGWKNSLKGVGYFLGSVLLQVDYNLALASMMALIVAAMPWAILGLDRGLGTAKSKNATWADVFCFENGNLNTLSLARLFLFASRDFWFEVPLPFFLRSPQCEGLGVDPCMFDSDCPTTAICSIPFETDGGGVCANLNTGGGCGGLGLNRVIVGAFLGGYIILYGQVQSWTPQLVTGPLKQTPPNKLTEVMWGMINCIPTLVAAGMLQFSDVFGDAQLTEMTITLITIIVSFAFIFAINSSIHSFLVVNYAAKEKVAVSVGFYYMSNAMGRLFGTIGSGLLYTYIGETANAYSSNDAVTAFAACFFAGTACSLLAAVITLRIDDQKAGLQCGPCCTIVARLEDDPEDDEEVAGGKKQNDEAMAEDTRVSDMMSAEDVMTPSQGIIMFSNDPDHSEVDQRWEDNLEPTLSTLPSTESEQLPVDGRIANSSSHDAKTVVAGDSAYPGTEIASTTSSATESERTEL